MIRILLLYIFCLCSILLMSCGTNNSSDDKLNDSSEVKSLSFAETDSISQKYEEIIIDYYEDGSPFVINYYPKDKPDNIVYQRKLYRNGDIFMEGGLDNGKRQGKWVAWYENGNIWSIGNYHQGLNHGSSKVYYDNATLRYNKEYDMGTPNGLWKFYDPQANLLGEIMYENGEIAWENDYMNNKNNNN